MQQLNKNASILIWSVMLSLIIAISFISISWKIHKNILSKNKNIQYFEQQSIIDWSLISQSTTQISQGQNIIFDSPTQKILPLTKNESYTMSFSGDTPFAMSLWIIEWWAVFYSYRFNGITTHSWVLNYTKDTTLPLDISTKTGTLTFTNLWGYSQVYINSEINFESPQKNYKIVQTIWNNTFIKSRRTLK
jgi:hypothetical protein